jgi:phosphoribosylaminoimidazole (AIR) synthetase
MGVGMIAVVEPGEARGFVERLRARAEGAWLLGEVVAEPGVSFV